MRIWTVERLERKQRKERNRKPFTLRKRAKLAGLLFMLALPLIGVLLLSAARGGVAAQFIAQIGLAPGGLGNSQAISHDAGLHSTTHSPHAYASVVVSAAKSQIGARYATIGDTPQTGFSCVGLVHWAFAQAGLGVPESAPGLAGAYTHVSGATPAGTNLQPGDVLLFVNTAWAGYSHASIYVGNGLMVSADSPQTGVRLESVNTPYWVAHWAGAVRIPGLIQDISTPKAPATPPPGTHPEQPQAFRDSQSDRTLFPTFAA
jgi:hypothetical protein